MDRRRRAARGGARRRSTTSTPSSSARRSESFGTPSPRSASSLSRRSPGSMARTARSPRPSGSSSDGIGERLLEAARGLDATVRRTAPGEQGVFFTAVQDGRLAVVRSFQAESGLRNFAFGLAEGDGGSSCSGALPVMDEPTGAVVLEAGTVVRFRRGGEDDCEGLTLVTPDAVAYEGCPAAVVDGEVVEVAPALVDDVAGGPRYYRRVVGSSQLSGDAARAGSRPLRRGGFRGRGDGVRGGGGEHRSPGALRRDRFALQPGACTRESVARDWRRSRFTAVSATSPTSGRRREGVRDRVRALRRGKGTGPFSRGSREDKTGPDPPSGLARAAGGLPDFDAILLLSSMRELRRLFPYLARYPRPVALGMLALLLAKVAAVLAPQVLKLHGG